MPVDPAGARVGSMTSTLEQPVPVLRVFDELVPPLSEAEAVVEADRCLECGGPYAEAPCTLACPAGIDVPRSEEHTSELQSHHDLVCRLLLEKKKTQKRNPQSPKKKHKK